jgi:hypothetical protein
MRDEYILTDFRSFENQSKMWSHQVKMRIVTAADIFYPLLIIGSKIWV